MATRFSTLAAVALLATILPTAAEAQDGGDEPAFVEVTGQAQVSVPADRARLRLAVETRAPGAREATTENADRMDAVIRALRGLDIEGAEIETTGYDLSPEYRRSEEGRAREIVAYRAVNHVVLTMDDVDAVGRALDAGIGAGANRVAGISFEASDTDEARLQAVRMAVADARAEAEAMAEALGVPLGPPLEVRGGAQGGPRPVPMMESVSMARAADTPVEAGDQTVTASVSIRFRLLVDR